ncbi:MAG: septum formation initiator family protein [Mycobacteriales bacterium]
MAATRRPGTGRSGRGLGAGNPKAPEASGRPAGLTTRAAVLGLVFCALVVSAALPLREYLGQRAHIAGLEQQQRAARERVAALEEQQAKLQDPAYIAALARDRLHFVRPGETAYVVIAPSAAPRDAAGKARALDAAVGPQAPWYSQLWGSVRSADRPVQVRTAK